MKPQILCFALSILLAGCGGSGSSGSFFGGGNSSNETETITEDTNQARREGYSKGYEDGYNAGYGWYQHGAYYNDNNSYQTEDGQRAYKNGYREGYDEGYEVGEEEQREEREQQRRREEQERLRDWHNWESEDVDGLYVYLDGVDDEDLADYIARERYDGEYIREGWRYYAKISYTWGEYEITLGERISSNFYKIRNSDIYLHFKWGLPDVSSGDEGVLDWDGAFSEFYKKPDNL